MTIYILELLIIAFFGVLTKNMASRKADKYFVVIAFTMIILVAGLRKYTVGIDLETQYARMYSVIGEMDWNDIFQLRYEPGYSIFCKVLSMISKEQQFYIMITSIMCYGAVGFFIYHNSEDVRLSTFVFVACNMMFVYMNVIRQALAVALILFGTEFIKRKQYIRFIAVIMLASTFHTSALIAILLVVFSIVGYRRKYILISLGAYVGSLFLAQRFFNIVTSILGMYGGYATKDNYGLGIINIYTVMNSVLLLIVFLLANRFMFVKINVPRKMEKLDKKRRDIKIRMGNSCISLNKKQNEMGSFDNEFLMYMMLLLLIFQSSAMSMAILSRLRIVFHPFLLLIIPKIVNRCPRKKIVKYGVYLFVCIYFIYTATHTSASNYGTIPYTFYWN